MTPDELPDDMKARTPAPEGEAWRTVPVEPTEAMIEAAHALWGEGTGVNYVQLEPEDFYAAMLAASPVVPVGSGEVDLNELLTWIDAMTEKHGNPVGTDYEQGVNDQGFRIRGKVAAILAAIRPTDTGWRDIATAPKGPKIDLWVEGERYGERYADCWWLAAGREGWFSNHLGQGDGDWLDDDLRATHWMPRSPAPTDTGRE